MSKNKTKLIFILLITILLIANPVVKAENEINTNENNTNTTVQTQKSNQTEQAQNASQVDQTQKSNQTEQTQNASQVDQTQKSNQTEQTQNASQIDQTQKSNQIEQTQTTTESDNSTNGIEFKRNDVYLTGDNIKIDYIVDGNVFILANNVTITSQIGGDVFVCSNNVTIEESAYIHGSMFAISDKITVSGILYDLYSSQNDLTINGQILRDIRTASNIVNLNGLIKRNAYINCTTINFKQNEGSAESPSSPIIEGNLNYSSTQEASIPQNVISGNINFQKIETEKKNTISTYLSSLTKFVATIVLVWLICLWLAPNFLKKCKKYLTKKKIFSAIGFGILTPIVLTFATLILLFLGVTSTIGLIALGTLCILLAISTAIFAITVTYFICGKLKVTKNFYRLGMLILCSIVLSLMGFIPYIGSIIGALAVIIGLGTIVSNLVIKNS